MIPLPNDKYKPASLEKMISLVAMLAERSRGPDHLLKLSTNDFNAIAGGKVSCYLPVSTRSLSTSEINCIQEHKKILWKFYDILLDNDVCVLT